jgi:hypothetical protein
MELLIIIGFILFAVLSIVVQLAAELKTYIKTFSLSEEWEAFKTVKFYKEN